MAATRVLDDSADLTITGLAWPEFLTWLDQRWEQGQHMTLVGVTGRGKTTFATQVLPLRRWVVALDAKGGDRNLHRAGFEKRSTWDPSEIGREVTRRLKHGEPMRVVLSPKRTSMDDLPAVRREFRICLRDVFEKGGWCVYVDELTITASRAMMDLWRELTALLIAARDKGSSVVTLMQQGEGTDFKTALRQYSVLVVWPTRNRETIASLSEIAGLPREVMERILRKLPFHSVLVIHTGTDELVITEAPEL